MQEPSQLQSIHSQTLLNQDLMIAPKQELIVNLIVKIAKFREEALLQGTGFLQMTTGQHSPLVRTVLSDEQDKGFRTRTPDRLTQKPHTPSVDTE